MLVSGVSYRRGGASTDTFWKSYLAEKYLRRGIAGSVLSASVIRASTSVITASAVWPVVNIVTHLRAHGTTFRFVEMQERKSFTQFRDAAGEAEAKLPFCPTCNAPIRRNIKFIGELTKKRQVLAGGWHVQSSKVLAVIVSSCLIGLIALFHNVACSAADLITGHDWRHFSGAAVSDNGITITPLGRMIVPKVSVPHETVDEDVAKMANNPPTPNPPINLRGPVLLVNGDFSVTAVMDVSSGKGAYLYLYGTLPTIYDEWRQEGKTLRLGLKDGTLVVSMWDGKSPTPVTKAFGNALSGAVAITVTRSGGNFSLQANGKPVGQIADPGLFSSGKVVFGADAELGGGFTLRQLTAEAVKPTATVKVVDGGLLMSYPVSGNSLRSLAESRHKPLYVGAAVAAIPLLTDQRYQALVGSEFNMITPENDMKFQFIHPQRDSYAFAEGDALVEFAERNHMVVHGHALVWHEALPTWVTGTKRSPSEVRQILVEHIRTVVGHYRGRVAEWDVVNEPLRDEALDKDQGLRSANPWFQAMGEEYIDLAFKEAHAADPAAKLYLNEYGIEEPGEKFDVLYKLVKRLLARGVPINGIGFQMHEDMEDGRYTGSDPKLVAINMQKIAALGLEVRVSEMDVNMNADPTARRLNTQADAFHDMLAMGLAQAGFSSFGVWGVTDKYSSLAPMFEYFKCGNGLLFDEKYQSKPAYDKIKEVLKEK
jgi:endo-1,4-beta-xylanase